MVSKSGSALFKKAHRGSYIARNVVFNLNACNRVLGDLLAPGNNLTKGPSSYTTTHPGLAILLDYPDVASLACPKPMLYLNGEDDPLFPRAAIEPAFEMMQPVWASQNACGRLVTRIWSGGHPFSQEMQEEVLHWLEEKLQVR